MALEAYRRIAAEGPVHNPELGEIRFTDSGAKKTTSRALPDTLRMIPKLRDILARGKLVNSAADRRGRPEIKAVHTLETPVRVGNRDIMARAVIREDAQGHYHYDLQRHDGFDPKQTPRRSVGRPALPKPETEMNPGEGEINLEPGQPRELEQGAQGKIRLTQDGRAVIILMRTADASTFLHETGHDWLERTMRDAADPDAPQHMRDDATTVRSYLSVQDGEPIPTRAHEKHEAFSTAASATARRCGPERLGHSIRRQ